MNEIQKLTHELRNWVKLSYSEISILEKIDKESENMENEIKKLKLKIQQYQSRLIIY